MQLFVCFSFRDSLKIGEFKLKNNVNKIATHSFKKISVVLKILRESKSDCHYDQSYRQERSWSSKDQNRTVKTNNKII